MELEGLRGNRCYLAMRDLYIFLPTVMFTFLHASETSQNDQYPKDSSQ